MAVVFRKHGLHRAHRHVRSARDVRPLLPHDRVRPVLGHDGAWIPDGRRFSRSSCSGSCSLRRPFRLSAKLADRYGRRRTLLWVTAAIWRVWIRLRADALGGHIGRHGDDGGGAGADGAHVRSARHGAVGAFPDDRSLHGQLGHLQPGRHLRRLARAVHRHLARRSYGLQYVGYYLDGRVRAHVRRAGADPRDKDDRSREGTTGSAEDGLSDVRPFRT